MKNREEGQAPVPADVGRKRSEESFINLVTTAIAAVHHVGRANYGHRERAALKAIHSSVETGRFVDPDEIEG